MYHSIQTVLSYDTLGIPISFSTCSVIRPDAQNGAAWGAKGIKELVNMKHTFIILQLKNFPFSEEQSWPRTASTTPQNCFKFDKSKIAYLYVWVRADCQDRQSHEPVGAPHSEVIMSCGQMICGTFDGDGKLPCPCLISRTPLLMSYWVLQGWLEGWMNVLLTGHIRITYSSAHTTVLTVLKAISEINLSFWEA